MSDTLLAVYDKPEQEVHPSEKFQSAVGQFDDLIEKHDDCSLIVLMNRLPMNAGKIRNWNCKNGKKWVLLAEDVYLLKNKIVSGQIVAAVAEIPVVFFDSRTPVPEGVEQAFKKRYLLVTPENVKELDKEHPYLFQDEE